MCLIRKSITYCYRHSKGVWQVKKHQIYIKHQQKWAWRLPACISHQDNTEWKFMEELVDFWFITNSPLVSWLVQKNCTKINISFHYKKQQIFNLHTHNWECSIQNSNDLMGPRSNPRTVTIFTWGYNANHLLHIKF